MTTTTLTGLSGKPYVFEVFQATDIQWKAVPGLYAFADAFGNPKYIGETGSFVLRNPGPRHEKWSEAAGYSACFILAMVYRGSESDREAIETDLIRAYDPPANTQKRTGAGLLAKRGFGF